MSDERKPALKAYVAAFLLRSIIKLLYATWRIEIVLGQEQLAELESNTRPALLCMWHNRMFFYSRFIEQKLVKKGFRITQLSSQSKDGDIGMIMGKMGGANVVRGSSSRGGAGGLRDMLRAVRKDKGSVVLLPDGSQGPIYKAKAGSIVLAQLAQVPLFPMSFSAEKCWQLGSWDKLMIPKPFSKISIKLGNSFEVPRKLEEGQLEEYRVKLENTLNELQME
ncbi:MAG: lysophospholipid acyltransferase family protein [Opitutaceae bacterium]|nr:lysophospholipid acyltransferase family protein [Opitutaceae bacterium]